MSRPLLTRWQFWMSLITFTVVTTGCAILSSQESRIIFQPSREDMTGRWGSPPKFEDVWIEIGRERIHGWWVERTATEGIPAGRRPTALYLHGARWNITGASNRIKRLAEAGFDVLAIDYRGFGKSDGDMPSEAMAYDDAQAAWRWLVKRVPNAADRYVYGHSLGGAIATELAMREPDAAGLILEATFTSVRDMIEHTKWGWLPVRALITQEFATDKKIAAIKMPVLFIHGTSDNVVPHEMSDRLYALAREPKSLLKVEGASHSGASWRGGDNYLSVLRSFFETKGSIAR